MNFDAELNSLLSKYVAGSLPVEQFVQKYDLLYLDHIEPSNIDSMNPELGRLFSNLFDACDLFEPHPGIREASPNYLGPDELDKKIREVANALAGGSELQGR